MEKIPCSDHFELATGFRLLCFIETVVFIVVRGVEVDGMTIALQGDGCINNQALSPTNPEIGVEKGNTV